MYLGFLSDILNTDFLSFCTEHVVWVDACCMRGRQPPSARHAPGCSPLCVVPTSWIHGQTAGRGLHKAPLPRPVQGLQWAYAHCLTDVLGVPQLFLIAVFR